jgi:mRNA-degrading endonuclease RelE of RelBE toxin-antitoxin system
LAFKEKYHPKIKKDLKKIDWPVREEIKERHLPNILADPAIGESLVGDLSGLHAYHFGSANQEFRIAYAISEEEQTVYFLMISKRENFYEILKRRL